MNKKIIIVGVIILALSMLFVACKNPEETQPTTTESTTITETTEEIGKTVVVKVHTDKNGDYVYNQDGEVVYLKDEQGFVLTPAEAYYSSSSDEEEGFFVGEGEGDSNASVNWEEIA